VSPSPEQLMRTFDCHQGAELSDRAGAGRRRRLTALFLGVAIHACGGQAPPATADSAQNEPIEPKAQDAPAAGPRVECAQANMFSPSVVSDAEYAARWGIAATTFAEAPTSKQRPLEDCGLDLLLPRLAALKCNDGSAPFNGDANAAHNSRRGNVGPGGRCGRIIDVYIAPCPEAEYEVFADMYFCSQATAEHF